jgi:hypothetical protein
MIDSLIWGKGLLGRLEAHLDKNVAIIVDLFLVITTVTSCHLLSLSNTPHGSTSFYRTATSPDSRMSRHSLSLEFEQTA